VTARSEERSGERAIRPRPLFCVTAPLHRDLALAGEVCRGRFPLVGTTVELEMPVRWRGASLPEDREWRILWHKFPYGLDLAHAFAATGERRFLDTWQDLVLSFIEQVPPGTEGDSSDVIGRRIANWVFAWDLFASAEAFPGLRPGAGGRILESLGLQVEHLIAHLDAARNHRTLELSGLFHTVLALPELDPDGERLAFAVEELHRNLRADFLADGVHCELSTHYHMEALRNFLAIRENARRYGVALPEGFDERLERACGFALHCHRPDGRIPALSDADNGGYRDDLALAADLFGREDLRFVATAGRLGRPPEETSPGFPESGYYVQRSAWSGFEDARFLLFDCGPLGAGGHGHYDALHFEAAAHGRPLVVDPGRYVYSEAGPVNWRHWFKSTAAHNTVTVDGLDQTPYRKTLPLRGTEARARLLGRESSPGLDVLTGEVRSAAYEAVHTRRVAFVREEYWLIEDRLRGTQPHRYELRFHLAPEAEGRTALESGRAVFPGGALLVAGPGEPRLEPGWVSPSYGVKHPAPVVAVAAPPAPDADFLTLLAPGRPVRLASRREERALRVEIEWEDGRHETVVLKDAEPALVLIPGWGLDRQAWRHQVDRFAGPRRVVVYEPGGDSLRRMVEGFGVFLEEQGLRRPILCGHALGAAVVLEYALAHPRDVAGLLLVNPPPHSPEVRRRNRAASERFRQAIEQYGPEVTVGPLRERFFGRAFRVARPREVAAWEARFLERSPEDLLRTMAAQSERDDRLPEPGELAVPALIVAGSGDALYQPAELEDLARRLGGGLLVLETGHLPMLEDPEGFNRGVEEWLGG
jgi:pimeloyl-ACP methyl ester carboxylesterase